MYLTVLLSLFLLLSIVGINVYLLDNLKDYGGPIFAILLWVNLNLLVIFAILFLLGRTLYKHYVENRTSDLGRKLLISTVAVVGFPFITLTSLAIVGNSAFLRVLTDENLKKILVDLEHLRGELKNLKDVPPAEKRRLDEQIAKLEDETKSFRSFVRHQKVVLINFITFFVSVALAVLLAAVVLGLLLVKTISNTFKKFSRSLEEISKGRLDEGVKINPEEFPISRIKELKEFARTFNRMVDELRNLYGRIRREHYLFEEVFNNVSTGVALFRSTDGVLIKANEGYRSSIGVNTLEKLEKWLSDKDYYRFEKRNLGNITLVFVEDLRPFLITRRYRAWKEIAERLAHDIKNPLNSIRIQVELLERLIEKKPERLSEFFPNLKREIDKQIDRITDLIDTFNNLSLQEIKLRKEFISLRSFLMELKRGFENDRFKVFVEVPPLYLYADGEALRRIFENLIKNAYEAVSTEGGGYVRIKAIGDEIHIIDSGPGIPPDRAASVFLPFVSDKGKGRGLGLFNVKRLVEEHGWSVSLLPPKEGEGAHFVIKVQPADIKRSYREVRKAQRRQNIQSNGES